MRLPRLAFSFAERSQPASATRQRVTFPAIASTAMVFSSTSSFML